MPEIIHISTPIIFWFKVNSYLIKREGDFVLIDTANPGKFEEIDRALKLAGCTPGSLRLIVLTHGDFDHCGNAVALKNKYGSMIAMHESDRGMVENADMFVNRNRPNPLIAALMKLLVRLPERSRFTPDVILAEGDSLAEFGLDAEVIEIPGHSLGSIGVMTADHNLFCGDLLANVGNPDLWTIMDDPEAAQASVEKLRKRQIETVYPGHGEPFAMTEFVRNYMTTAGVS